MKNPLFSAASVKWRVAGAGALGVSVLSLALWGAAEPRFLVQRIDGPSLWYGPFSEGCAVFDVDRDGVLDITAGPYWYKGPDFKKLPLRDCPTHSVEFVRNLGEFPYDVNEDGWIDLISASWFDNGIFWYENTRGSGRLWPAHKIADSVGTEALIFDDLDGDGRPDILPNHYRPQEIFWVEILPGPEFKRHVIGREGSRHGLGLGDVDGDGRKDVITMDGWYQAPAEPRREPWQWHPEWKNEGAGGIQMLAYDVNGDGLNDIIYGMGHDYGLFWLEQQRLDGVRSWKRHTIQDRWSQAHTLVLADLDGDGRLDLITGKRIRGHGENDPGSLDPIGVFWYQIDPARGTFKEHVLAYNSLAGTGMNINVVDLDGDGDLDLVMSGKSGLYLFENMSVFQKQTSDIIQQY